MRTVLLTTLWAILATGWSGTAAAESCDSDWECPGWEECHGGECEGEGELILQPCETDADCENGEPCTDGKCRPPAPPEEE